MSTLTSIGHAQGVTVRPGHGTQTTNFRASGPRPRPPDVFCPVTDIISIDGYELSHVTLPFLFDTICVTPTCSQLSIGTHTFRFVRSCDCEACSFDVSATFEVRAHDPVLLVHGICGDSSSWDPVAQVLADSGYVVDRLQYTSPSGSSQRPLDYAHVLEKKLGDMDCDGVAIVAHSMGGLIAREYMRQQVANHDPIKISQLVTLGTPHHGSDALAWLLKLDPITRKLLGPRFGSCLTNPLSEAALEDMVPGADFLNRLNYNLEPSLSDRKDGHGWDAHHVETMLPGIYMASIAGTGSICNPKVAGIVWRHQDAYHANDVVVATESSLLAKTTTFRALDVDLLDLSHDKPACHSNLPGLTTPCDEPYYSSRVLGERIASILKTSPSSPPVGAPSEGSLVETRVAEASTEDSLQTVPTLPDTIQAGQAATKTQALPVTSLARFTLLSTDAHLSLTDPNGRDIGVADTSIAGGILFFTAGDPGFEGFQLTAPTPGTWMLHINASASISEQQFAAITEYVTGSVPTLSLDSESLILGNPAHVRGQFISDGSRRTDVTWSASVLQPDGTSRPFALYDDGVHGDSLADDGIYGSSVMLSGGVGSYRFNATASAPGVGPLEAIAHCQLSDIQDLAVQPNEIWLSKNVAQADDSLTVYAVVHNNSSKAAIGVSVEIHDLPADNILGSSIVDLPVGAAVTVQAPWVPAAPDSHVLRVQVSPHVLDESDYSNNKASRIVVLGSPVSVGPHDAPGLRFDPPYPNPTSLGVLLSFAVPPNTVGTFSILDILGRRVRAWTDLAPGSHWIAWDGTGTRGEHLPPGVYMCRLDVGGATLHRKLVLRR